MKEVLRQITNTFPPASQFHLSILIFRVALSIELMVAHGLKKIGIGVENPEIIPNPVHLPEALNQCFAISANLFFPVLVIAGLFTRIVILPILAVTLMGYFVVHRHDSLLEKDMPFMYSLAYVMLFVLGPGKYSFDYFIHQKLIK